MHARARTPRRGLILTRRGPRPETGQNLVGRYPQTVTSAASSRRVGVEPARPEGLPDQPGGDVPLDPDWPQFSAEHAAGPHPPGLALWLGPGVWARPRDP